MTVVLHITRSSGSTESHELEAAEDLVHVPYSLLSSQDIVSLDVDVREPEPEPEPAV